MTKPYLFKKNSELGVISITVLIFGIVSAIVVSGYVILTTQQYQYSARNVAREQALTIAEAGVQYYRWHLAHNPDDYWDGTDEEPGPYEHDYLDPEGGIVGKYSLEITPPPPGSSAVTITSTGWSETYPAIKRTVTATYGLPSLAQFSFLHNANVWFGQGITVHGRVFSNGGIRQDGINTSLIQSAKETYICGTETGCSPSQTRSGVWGNGGPDSLWEYPVPQVDFDSILVDFNSMKTAAQAEGVYLPPSSNYGYQLIFSEDGTVNVYEAIRSSAIQGYDVDTGCENLYQTVRNKTLIGSYSLSEKQIFFIEDTTWVEGIVNGRATVVAARFPFATNNEDIWISDNIIYEDINGDDSLGLIAQRNINFVRNLPTDFHINAALLAQNGKVMRHYYGLSSCGGSTTYAVRDYLTVFGALISNQKSYWNWGTAPSSGFEAREVTYDARLYLSPPPYFPTSGEYEFISWTEDNSP